MKIYSARLRGLDEHASIRGNFMATDIAGIREKIISTIPKDHVLNFDELDAKLYHMRCGNCKDFEQFFPGFHIEVWVNSLTIEETIKIMCEGWNGDIKVIAVEFPDVIPPGILPYLLPNYKEKIQNMIQHDVQDYLNDLGDIWGRKRITVDVDEFDMYCGGSKRLDIVIPNVFPGEITNEFTSRIEDAIREVVRVPVQEWLKMNPNYVEEFLARHNPGSFY